MTDLKLVEAVAAAMSKADDDRLPMHTYRILAEAALAAIPASGEWWVAPWRLTEEMRKNVGWAIDEDIWSGLRTAFLAKPQNQWTAAEAEGVSHRQKMDLAKQETETR